MVHRSMETFAKQSGKTGNRRFCDFVTEVRKMETRVRLAIGLARQKDSDRPIPSGTCIGRLIFDSFDFPLPKVFKVFGIPSLT